MTDPILDQIDQVLDDFATSPDAMRWTPEHHPKPTRPGILLELPRPERHPAMPFEQIAATVRALGEVYNAFARGVLGAARQVHKTLAKWTHLLQNPTHNRARCRICSPFANPYPLVAGAEYRRRRQARKKSRR
ncbi:MAG TPA: hypothetical protein VIP06_02905 [Nocardioides sp.]